MQLHMILKFGSFVYSTAWPAKNISKSNVWHNIYGQLKFSQYISNGEAI